MEWIMKARVTKEKTKYQEAKARVRKLSKEGKSFRAALEQVNMTARPTGTSLLFQFDFNYLVPQVFSFENPEVILAIYPLPFV